MSFKTVNSQYVFVKLSGIGPWVIRINWCEGHQCDSTNMVVRLSNIRPKTGKKHKKCWTAWWPYQLSHIDAVSIKLSYWPKDQFREKILRIDGFEKLIFFESAILEFFFKNKCFLLNPRKSSQRFLGSKEGSKFWWLTWFPAHEVLGQHLCSGL